MEPGQAQYLEKENVRANTAEYDIAIIGGGLAGLALSIQSARAGYKTILFEKEKYPFHKVCGEYVSLESWNFLEDLGLPLSQMDLPMISRLMITTPSGKESNYPLPLGGFGISRYKLDDMLASIARESGVELKEETKVSNVEFRNEMFNVQCSLFNAQARVVAGAFGKRSNLDVKWKRKFISDKNNRLNNYIAVKYHVRADWPADLIALHNFDNGYCGISQIEENKFCLCYLTTAKNLEKAGKSVEQLEKAILSRNPYLKNIFSTVEKLYSSPVTISQISFEKKSLIHDHILMVGDAAGMITPLCGNGMSMALHASKFAFEQIDSFLQNKISREEMEFAYRKNWTSEFSARLKTGRTVQRFFGHPLLTTLFLSSLKPFPFLANRLIRHTHGQPF
jgi:flavin-dependent dehydrogenase